MLKSSALVGAIAALQHTLKTSGSSRCSCCNKVKPHNASWRVAGYLPPNPQHPAVAYALCGDCLKSKSKIAKAARGIETASRDAAERMTCPHS
jgi:hypothetical protein